MHIPGAGGQSPVPVSTALKLTVLRYCHGHGPASGDSDTWAVMMGGPMIARHSLSSGTVLAEIMQTVRSTVPRMVSDGIL